MVHPGIYEHQFICISNGYAYKQLLIPAEDNNKEKITDVKKYLPMGVKNGPSPQPLSREGRGEKWIARIISSPSQGDKGGFFYFFSRRLIFYGDILSLDWLWYDLGGVIVELAHKITAGKADRGCSQRAYPKERQPKEFLFLLLSH